MVQWTWMNSLKNLVGLHKYYWKHGKFFDAMITQDPEIFEEESITLCHTAYNYETKKLLLEKVNTKNKGHWKDRNIQLILME
jgi:hypothetical protein